MNQTILTIRNRRSIRKFKPKPISKTDIKEIIVAGRYAPSSHNSQPWRFIILTNKDKIRSFSEGIKIFFRKVMPLWKLASIFNKRADEERKTAASRAYNEKDLFLYEAPLVIVICGKKSWFHVRDCSCAAQNMMLAARSLGIGSCWIGFADLALNHCNVLRNKLNVPKGTDAIGTLVFGYPEKFPESALPRKEKADVVEWFE